ncbi:MAG: ABC transporter permease [Acidobacteriota bacterium]
MLAAAERLGRRLGSAPGFTATVVLTLSLGIAANVAVFSVIKGVLLEPLPFDDPEQLIAVWHEAPGLNFDRINQSAALDIVYREESEAFSGTAMWQQARAAVTGTGEPEEVRVLSVTDTFFPLLGVDTSLGRRFTAEDDAPGAADTVLLTHAYWQKRFGGREEAVGDALTLNGRPHAILGVLPKGFAFLDQRAELFTTLNIDESEEVLGRFNYRGMARLREGATIEQANAEMDRLLPVTAERFPGGLTLEMMQDARFAASVHPLAQDVVGNISSALWILLGSVGVVLLVACANVANLVLVRAEGRHRELALRSALGASRARLMRSLLGESLVLALLGGAAGSLLAWGLLQLLVWAGPRSVPRLDQVGIDAGVLVFALCASLLAGLIFGILPALRGGSSGEGLSESLKDGGRGSAGRERYRTRSALVVAQVALGLVLLVGSGLMLRSFAALQRVEPGFAVPEELLTFRLSIPSAEVEEPLEVLQLQRRLIERMAALPGVESVGATSSHTMDDSHSNDALLVEDFPTEEGSLPPVRRYKFTMPGYHETMGNPLIAGRGLEWADLEEDRLIAVVTRDFAEELWGSPEAALGKRIADGVPGLSDVKWREIVGVVGSIRDDGLSQATVPTIFWPAKMPIFWGSEPWIQRSLSFAVRSSRAGDPSLLREIQAAVWELNPNLPLAGPRTMDEVVQRSLARTSFTLLMLGVAAGMALLIGSVGIYGVISYIVAQRTREIGVRLALGAGSRQVTSMMVRYGMGLAGAGVLAGLVIAGLTTGALSRLLFGVEPRDPLTFATVAVVLVAVAFAASAVAGMRAGRVDPMEALRSE